MQVSDFMLDVEGAREYFDGILNPYVLDSSKDEAKYGQSEAQQIIQNAHAKLSLYGKITTLIGEYCSNEAIDTGGETQTLSRCLKIISIYSTLSTSHTAFLIEAAAKILASGFKGADKYSKTLIQFTKKRLERDNKTLSFLSDPMKSFDKTKVIYELYAHPAEYKDIIDHLLVINERFNIFHQTSVVFCPETKLKGLCREIQMVVNYFFFLLVLLLICIIKNGIDMLIF